MKQKTRKGSKAEDRWLGPYTIEQLLSSTCCLRNTQHQTLKTKVNLTQLKPYYQSANNTDEEDEVIQMECPSSQSDQDSDQISPLPTVPTAGKQNSPLAQIPREDVTAEDNQQKESPPVSYLYN